MLRCQLRVTHEHKQNRYTRLPYRYHTFTVPLPYHNRTVTVPLRRYRTLLYCTILVASCSQVLVKTVLCSAAYDQGYIYDKFYHLV